ncbi:uroporphyrin-III C-methyltransferase [compost metagenome]
MKNLPLIAAALLEGGLAADTPVAVLEAATTSDERILVGRLDGIAAETAAAGIKSPALIAIGHIVSVRTGLTGQT